MKRNQKEKNKKKKSREYVFSFLGFGTHLHGVPVVLYLSLFKPPQGWMVGMNK